MNRKHISTRSLVIRTMNRFTRSIKAFFFIRGIGRLSREYSKITDSYERLEFAANNFGPGFYGVLVEREIRND